ncbi:MAG: hypothetical protein NZM26_04850 [Patescibacteria group bacterium]|nr:hypothetical protein [Patescibacteria group bacterium]MCX7928205.1 hypothetical protein [Patescibacteria group bacterium]
MLKKIFLLSISTAAILTVIFWHKNTTKNVYAIDPLIITYNNSPTPNPVFNVANFLPGDNKIEKIKVKNNLPSGSFGVSVDGILDQEQKNLAEILQITITEVGFGDIYGGSTGKKTLKQFLNSPPINLGVFPSGSEKEYEYKIFFPHESGNEYKNGHVVFTLIFNNFITIDLPKECAHLANQIVNVIEGTEGNDNIHSTYLSDLILAKGGNDKIRASSGSDCIVAGDGNDTIDAGTGNEVILGGGGNDNIRGGTGNDTIYGGSGNDRIDAGSGDDVVYGDDGDDNIEGGSDKDKLYGGKGKDDIRGGSNNDLLDGGEDFDKLNGNSGQDTCKFGEVLSSCEL